jgi:hypothetical protein
MGTYHDRGLIISQTQAATVSSQPIDMAGEAGLCIHTEWTGTVLGALVLEGRNDPALQWQAISEVTLASPAGSAGGQLTNIGNVQARFYRVRYTHTSGTGSLNVSAGTKEAGL